MRRPWAEVPDEGIGEGRHGQAAEVVPLEWWGAPGRRHAVRTVIKAMMALCDPRFCWFSPVRMDMPLAGCRGHRSCGQPLGGGSCGGGPPARGGHWAGGITTSTLNPTDDHDNAIPAGGNTATAPVAVITTSTPISNGSITIDRDGVVADVSGDGRAGGDDSYWACGTSLLKDEVFSLSSRTMVVPAAVVSAERATSLLTAAVLSLSSEAVAATVTAATVS